MGISKRIFSISLILSAAVLLACNSSSDDSSGDSSGGSDDSGQSGGSGTADYVCDVVGDPNASLQVLCLEYTGDAQSDATQVCDAQDDSDNQTATLTQDSNCPTANLLGICTVEGPAYTVETFYYSTGLITTAELAAAACTAGDSGGSWEAALRIDSALDEEDLEFTFQYADELPESFFDDDLVE